jgi:hypothetical protein
LFASLLIPEGRHSIFDLAAQLGHDATMMVSTYAHVVAELRDAPERGEADSRRAARAGRQTMRPKYGPRTARPSPDRPATDQLHE